MGKNYPQTIDDLNDVLDWRNEKLSQADEEGARAREQLSPTDMAKEAHIDLLRLTQAIAQAQASIYVRALAVCDTFFDWHEKKKREAQVTKVYSDLNKLRPRVIRNPRYGTVDMSWVVLLAHKMPGKPSHTYRSEPGQAGHYHKAADGTTVHVRYKYIKKGATMDRYPDSTFKNEPLWAQTLEKEIEDKFCALRKEQAAYTAMRKNIVSAHRAQLKQLNEFTEDELLKWGIEKLEPIS